MSIDPLGETHTSQEFGPVEELERAPDDLVGQKIGAYLLERKLGEGGMGVVYEGVHESLGQRAAIKLLHGRFGNDSKTLQRFFNEARAISIIEHPGLVKVYDYQKLSDGTAYLILEFLKGQSLEARLVSLRAKGERLSIEVTIGLAGQVASALSAAHRSGIVHCDLKPDNIFLTPDQAVPEGERIKVLDFGIAKFLTDVGTKKTTVGMILGTPRYMSPEQCEGRDKVDERVDVYALGVILYELLSGDAPFHAEGAAALMRQHMVKPPPPLRERSSAPGPLCELCHQMLAKDPALRPTMDQVEARLGGAAVPGGRRGAPSLFLGLGAVLLLGAGGALWLLRGQTPMPPPQDRQEPIVSPRPPQGVPPPPPVVALPAPAARAAVPPVLTSKQKRIRRPIKKKAEQGEQPPVKKPSDLSNPALKAVPL